jgi:hypothetical protein
MKRSFCGRVKDCLQITLGYWKAIFFVVTDYNFFYDRNIIPEEKHIENLNEGVLTFVKELAEKGQLKDAPVKTERFGKWYELIIGIDNDTTLSITLSDDDLEVLKNYRRP